MNDAISMMSTADLMALRDGDVSRVSSDGLRMLRREQVRAQIDSDPISQGARDFNKDAGGVSQAALNLLGGGIRGAGSIGATVMYPIDKAMDLIKGDRGPDVTSLVTGKKPASRNEERRLDMDSALRAMGIQPDSWMYQGGKLGTEVAGTLGVGGTLANGAGRLGMPMLADALASGGMSTGARLAPNAPFGARALDMATRIGGGAITGGASAGLIDPEYAKTGVLFGGALAPVTKLAGVAGDAISSAAEAGAKRLMQSAIKPTIAQLKSGDAATAVQTLLERGLNPTRGGVQQLRTLVDDLDNQVTSKIAGSTATVDKQAVLNRLNDTRNLFGRQVSPTADLNAIDNVANDFAVHPLFAGGGSLPVQVAQDLKRGTYEVLGKKYGQLGSAETEAQKALARGLKEEIAAAVPDVQPLNAEMSKLLTTMDVAERRALMEMNKNPMGLAALAQNPWSWAMFMADKSALFKSLAARMLNGASSAPGASMHLLENAAAKPLVRNGLLELSATNP